METPDPPRLQIDCLFCLSIADEAVVTGCCTKIACRACFEEWNAKDNRCPHCKSSNCSVNNESFVRKVCQEASEQIQFFVKTLTRTITLKMKELDTIEMLFQRVHQKEGINTDQIRLNFGTKMIVRSSKSLRSIKLQSKSTVHLFGRLKGGARYIK